MTTSELLERVQKLRTTIRLIDEDLQQFDWPEYDEDHKVERHPELSERAFDFCEIAANELYEVVHRRLFSGRAS